MLCPKRKSEIKLYKYKAGIDKFRWYSGQKGAQGRCEAGEHSCWFTKSKLTLVKVMLAT
jgi:hypothetical protein